MVLKTKWPKTFSRLPRLVTSMSTSVRWLPTPLLPFRTHYCSLSSALQPKTLSFLVHHYFGVQILTMAERCADLSRAVNRLGLISYLDALCLIRASFSTAPCGLRGCENWPSPFPGRMSYKATKPGLVSVLYLSMRYMVLFIRAPFYVLIVFIAMCAVFSLFRLSYQYLPSYWQERPLWAVSHLPYSFWR